MFTSNKRLQGLCIPAFLLVLLAAGWAWLPAPAKAAAAGDDFGGIRFQWAFGALSGGESNPRLRSITQDAVLKSGDKFKMMVELKKKCFIYVIYQNSQGELSILFPYSLKQFSADYQPAKKYYIPRGDAWFQLDDQVGTERFYLLASEDRLSEVEYLLTMYEGAEAGKKADLAGRMIAEIQAVERRHREVLAHADRPIEEETSRGIERAQGQDPSDIAVISREIVSKDTYTRTFTIQHR